MMLSRPSQIMLGTHHSKDISELRGGPAIAPSTARDGVSVIRAAGFVAISNEDVKSRNRMSKEEFRAYISMNSRVLFETVVPRWRDSSA